MAGAAMPRITLVKLSNFICTLPNHDEQVLISNYIESNIQPIENAIIATNKIISLLQERKQIIINEVVTGKLKVV
jgi:type I restriction enzyme S subunit